MTLKPLILVTSLSCLTFNAFASTPSFNEVYAQYQAAIESSNKQEAKSSAKLAYELGKQQFEKSSLNLANLALNYAQQLSHHLTKDESKLKEKLFQDAIRIIEEKGNDVAKVNALLLHAEGTNSSSKAKQQIKSAELIFEKQQDPLVLGQFYQDAGEILIRSAETYRPAVKYLHKASEIFAQHIPESAIDRLSNTMLLAHIDKGKKRYNSAIERYESVIKVFDENLEFDHQFELTAHSNLISLYEKKGKSDLATKHYLAIAQMVPWQDSQEQTPVYRVHPEYPVSAVRGGMEGWVRFSYAISKSGFVKDVQLLEHKGSKVFIKESRKALEQWRFAPKFENGHAVDAENLTVQLDFKITRG